MRNNNCSNTTAGNGSSGVNPVNPYTFTPTLVKGGVTGTKASGEVKAGASISKAPVLTIGHFEAGGGNLVDFWKIKLVRGDHVRLNVGDPTNNAYTFSLYGSGNKDSNFGQASVLSSRRTDSGTSSDGCHRLRGHWRTTAHPRRHSGGTRSPGPRLL